MGEGACGTSGTLPTRSDCGDQAVPQDMVGGGWKKPKQKPFSGIRSDGRTCEDCL